MTALTWPQIVIAVAILLVAIGCAHVLRDIDGHARQIAWLIGVNRQQATRIRDLSTAAGLPPFDDTVQLPDRIGTIARLRAWLWTLTVPDPGPDVQAADDTPTEPVPAQPRPTPGPRTVPTALAIDRWQKTEVPTGLVDDVEFARILAGIEDSLHAWRASRDAAETSQEAS